ncbi:cysteine proteinase [Pelomyxa schiedti]|nr:cysteine proteinase [Pelomyxa schiedti]
MFVNRAPSALGRKRNRAAISHPFGDLEEPVDSAEEVIPTVSSALTLPTSPAPKRAKRAVSEPPRVSSPSWAKASSSVLKAFAPITSPLKFFSNLMSWASPSKPVTVLFSDQVSHTTTSSATSTAFVTTTPTKTVTKTKPSVTQSSITTTPSNRNHYQTSTPLRTRHHSTDEGTQRSLSLSQEAASIIVPNGIENSHNFRSVDYCFPHDDSFPPQNHAPVDPRSLHYQPLSNGNVASTVSSHSTSLGDTYATMSFTEVDSERIGAPNYLRNTPPSTPAQRRHEPPRLLSSTASSVEGDEVSSPNHFLGTLSDSNRFTPLRHSTITARSMILEEEIERTLSPEKKKPLPESEVIVISDSDSDTQPPTPLKTSIAIPETSDVKIAFSLPRASTTLPPSYSWKAEFMDERMNDLNRRLKQLEISQEEAVQRREQVVMNMLKVRVLEQQRQEEERIKKLKSQSTRPLTTSEQRLVTIALGSKRDEDKTADIKAFSERLTQADILTLKPGAWLNDEVINLYMEILQERSRKSKDLPHCHFFNTFFYPLLSRSYDRVKKWSSKVDIFNMDMLLFPIHQSGNHWCLAVINIRDKRFEYYDSFHSPNDRCLQLLRNLLEAEAKARHVDVDVSGWPFYQPDTIPLQTNGSDCGVFACKFAECISRECPFTFSQTATVPGAGVGPTTSSSSMAATALQQSASGAFGGVARVPTSRGEHHLRHKYEATLAAANDHPERAVEKLHELRTMVLMEGVPRQSTEEITGTDTRCSLRGRIWKALLGVRTVSADQYVALIRRGPAPQSDFEIIERDLERTFAHDPVYNSNASTPKLRRLLNAFVHSIPESKTKVQGYIQGMNLIAGCLLHVMPELDAFHTFCVLIFHHIPMYFNPALVGAHTATKLFTVILKQVDLQLYNNLKAKRFSPVLVLQPLFCLCASTPPFEQVLYLWDFFFAFGCHLSVPTCVAQLVLNRTEILAQPSIYPLFQMLPDVNRVYVEMANTIALNMPEDVWSLLCRHTRDPVAIPTSLFDPKEFEMDSLGLN